MSDPERLLRFPRRYRKELKTLHDALVDEIAKAVAARSASLADRPHGRWRLVDVEIESDGRLDEERWLSLYDLARDVRGGADPNEWRDEWEWVLLARSTLEFVRDWLEPERATLLDRADACWREHPEAFNRLSSCLHRHGPPADAMDELIEDDAGDWPEIPESHWWWRPLPTEPSP